MTDEKDLHEQWKRHGPGTSCPCEKCGRTEPPAPVASITGVNEIRRAAADVLQDLDHLEFRGPPAAYSVLKAHMEALRAVLAVLAVKP